MATQVTKSTLTTKGSFAVVALSRTSSGSLLYNSVANGHPAFY
jgi:hypothetical protein